MPNVSSTKVLTQRTLVAPSKRSMFVRKIMGSRFTVFGGSIVILLALLAIVGPLLTPYNPLELGPDALAGPSASHWMGTDEFGRDLATRILYGARTSLGIGASVALITAFFGATIGLLASYYRAADNILMRIMDGLMAFPSILLAISLMAALGPKTENVVLSLSVVFTPYIARVVRSAALSIKDELYIDAARVQGVSDLRIILKHVAPNILSPLVVQVTFIFADAIINEASLSFLGAGVPAPAPSWGSILLAGKSVIFESSWMVIFAGGIIILSVLGLNLLGDGLRDLLDPHVQNIRKKRKPFLIFRGLISSRRVPAAFADVEPLLEDQVDVDENPK
ncbi:ABC transporter permease [Arthrobacter cryoconiti]|uniref:ABC transporter permease n=1 Tax=Arthrobacter cryoconiti TaxID=748907 RepID=A0ABV8R4K2_9MICC|nr:ABC transporter permease [Arthrobacter cryoconiti]MCC9069813.1 ABC transporter permease [Arthrobacter cryoconiti]